MFISKIRIQGFRGIKDIEINFKKQLNVLIGENNSGKSAVIDALRICCEYGNQRRSVYISPEDFFFDESSNLQVNEISFDCFLEAENPQDEKEAALFYELLSMSSSGEISFEIHHRYKLENKNGRDYIRSTVWGGNNTSQTISPYVSSLLDCIYIDPLRDADRYLNPSGSSQVGSLLQRLTPDTKKQDEMAKTLGDTLKDDKEWSDLLTRGEVEINEHLKQTTFITNPQSISIDVLPFSFKGISNNSFLRLPWPGLTDKESVDFTLRLQQNGLGYNNIIYVCTILGNIKSLRENGEDSYMALLIEEPESHLHPQLQNTLFTYLDKLKDLQVQIFLTSHSPTITAKTNLDHITILKRSAHQKINSLSLSNSALGEDDKRYLSKFLDVTKSQLFFSNGVLLVEGISEALLMESFAIILGEQYGSVEKYSLTRNGIELVIVNGVSFRSFARLFNASDPAKQLGVKCSIISDDDREKSRSNEHSTRKLEGGLLKTFFGKSTFEFELAISCETNLSMMLDVYFNLHPTKTNDLKAEIYGEAKCNKFVDALLKDGTGGKSAFSQALSDFFEINPISRSKFIVPKYIRDALTWLVEG